MSVIQVSLANGLGNLMFQWAFAKAYAEKHGCELQVKLHPWQKVFDIDDVPSGPDLPHRDGVHFEEWDGEVDIHIYGLAQHQKNLIYTRADARRWFKLRPQYEELVRDVPSMDLVANLRRGDYCYACNPFVVVSEQSYLDACDKHGLDKSRLHWLNGETHYRIPALPNPRPWASLTDAERHDSIDFLPDLALMMRAKVLLRSNSTFAWWAAALGNARVFCPDVSKVNPLEGVTDGGRIPQRVPFVEGNHMPVLWGNPELSELHLKE